VADPPAPRTGIQRPMRSVHKSLRSLWSHETRWRQLSYGHFLDAAPVMVEVPMGTSENNAAISTRREVAPPAAVNIFSMPG
jgi:hypothetical protein